MKPNTRNYYAALAAFALGAGSALGQATQTMDADAQVSNDSWNQIANWNATAGPIPGDNAADDAIVGSGLFARVNLSSPTYSGGLDLSGATMTIENVAGAENALGTGTITMNNSTITVQRATNITFPAINLAGPGTFTTTSNAGDDDDRNYGGVISGTGLLTVKLEIEPGGGRMPKVEVRRVYARAER
jgi:hypothetical protein